MSRSGARPPAVVRSRQLGIRCRMYRDRTLDMLVPHHAGYGRRSRRWYRQSHRPKAGDDLRTVVLGVGASDTCALAQSPVQDQVDRPQGRESPAVALEREVGKLVAMIEKPLWPGFAPLAIPLAVYDGERTFLFRHPAPPEGFTPVSGSGARTYSREGRYEAVVANSSAQVGGVSTATVLLDCWQPGRSLVDLAAVAIHEAFHVFQRAHHPGWFGNELDLLAYPVDASDLVALSRLETEALRLALAADEATVAAGWARRALALRRERYECMDASCAAYERGTELNEGLATFVAMRAAGRRDVELPSGEFGPAEVRLRAYAVGAAMACLLDRFIPGWPEAFETGDHQYLDSALAAALPRGEACTFDDACLARARQKARADVAALLADRAERLLTFEGRTGWRMVVEAGSGDLLWPQAFDPLNLIPVGAGRLLHTRFLRLGHDTGWLEVLNAEVLTEGAGSHPLAQGIRRVVATGLPEPEVSEADGRIRVQRPGLTAEFNRATVTQGDEVVSLRLGSP